jgi:hypothetical protein
MSSKEKLLPNSAEADPDTDLLEQALGDKNVAFAVGELIKSVRLSDVVKINGKLDALAQPKTFRHAASSIIYTVISLMLGFGAGMFFHDKGWPVVAWVTQLFA